ncbi:MAG: glycerophosphodiester phosphodiesterase [Clostridium thermopalmarium]|uniref:glycerophosphodiester phosphodiesterase n=1 Tax=Clostridium thermopalmarium TaxID=29373 RepID=UPI002355F21C|nr:glycerophosphodiester phosphodiesterase [Clostridium thermopalmarium]MBE6043484.1 glycerophosphodiester phosphodiesterase [Clostridium thermopalmarium]
MIINYAHRGASGYFPENTMLAFEKVVSLGATGIETDIHMTKDGVLVLIHDERVDRTTNGTGFVKDYTYKELLKLDAGSYFSKEFEGLKVPTLEELFQFASHNELKLDLELKNNIVQYENIEKKTVDLINKYNMNNRVTVSSFNHYSLMKIKKISKKIKIGLLYMTGLVHPEKYAKFLGAEALHPYFLAVNSSKIIKRIKKAKIEIVPYTIDDGKFMKRFIDFEVDGITTNYPDKLNKLLQDI